MNRLLVTGAGGFVGRHVVSAAAKAGFEVHATSRRPPDRVDNGVQWHLADLLSDEGPATLVRDVRPTHICHAAWETTHGSYWTSTANALWLSATSKLAHAFAEIDGQRFVLVGSCAEYDWSHGVMLEDETPTRPHSFYGVSKLAAHIMLQAMTKIAPFAAATGRIFFAYGPYENAQRIVPYVCQRLIGREDVHLTSGVQIRDFLHIDDVAHALVTLLSNDVTGAFNIGMGRPVRLAEIARILGKEAQCDALIRLGSKPDRDDDVPVLVPQIERLLKLGWSPRLTLEEGLAQSYKWWLERA